MIFGRRAHDIGVVGVIGFDRERDDVAIQTIGVILDIDAGEELDAVQLVESPAASDRALPV